MFWIADRHSPMTKKLFFEWIALAAVTALALSTLPPDLARGAISNLVSLIAAIYVGFALKSDSLAEIPKQVLACAGFVALAHLGLWIGWWFLVVALAPHGLWDVHHHGENGRAIVPVWCQPACAIYD